MSKMLLLGFLLPLSYNLSNVELRREKVQLHISAENPHARPALPALPNRRMVGVLIKGQWQLDGLNCFNCRFQNATLTYAGGQFRCDECWFDGSLSIMFSGAAANALAVNDWVQQLHDSKQWPPTMLPITDFLRQASADALKVTLISPRASP